MSQDLLEAKQRLVEKLGPCYSTYIQLLGKWFRGSISKDEFDKSAKQLINQNFVLEHNRFWLAFFHHCASNTSSSIQTRSYQSHDPHVREGDLKQNFPNGLSGDNGPETVSNKAASASSSAVTRTKIRCLPSKVITHMKIYVIAWEMGLDSADDLVSVYLNLALHHFLKNIITELICTKTAFRLRENRFRYAIGVKPINPYLSNSLKIYSANLEYDPYQIESNKMNSSLVDTYAYNDSLFPSRLHEAQALYEYACSTTTFTQPSVRRRTKRLKLSEISLGYSEATSDKDLHEELVDENLKECFGDFGQAKAEICSNEDSGNDDLINRKQIERTPFDRRLTLYHLLTAFFSDRTIIPSQSLYSISLERILTRLFC